VCPLLNRFRSESDRSIFQTIFEGLRLLREPQPIESMYPRKISGQVRDKNFTRVLSGNIAAILNTQRVESYPWSRGTPVAYQVIVDVERFDTGTDKQAKLNARWSIRDGHDGKVLYAT
jgi:hypothetical protein